MAQALLSQKRTIVLYNPNPKRNEKKYDVALALLSVSSMLDKEGFDIKIMNHSDEDVVNKLLEQCREAICFGLTVMTGNQIGDAAMVSKLIKENYPELPIIYGGWHASILPYETIDNDYVDIVVKGQGESSLTEIVHALIENKPLHEIKGILFKENGKIITTAERQTEDLNNFPPLPYHLVPAEKLVTPVTEIASRTITYFTSMGCPHRCTFCADPLVYKRRWKALKAERVVDDMQRMVNDYDINGIVFTDTNFFTDEKRVAAICRGIIERGLKFRWGSVNGRTEHLLRYKDETWELLKQANFHSFLIGAESALEDVLLDLKKDATVQQTVEFTKKCAKYGFKIYFSFFIGMPDERYKDNPEIKLNKEINALMNLIDTILGIEREHMYYLLIYTPYPGSPLFDTSKNLGFNPPKSFEEWADFEHDTTNSPWIPKKYVDLMDQLNMLYIPFLTNNIFKKADNYSSLGRLFIKPLCHLAYLPIKLRWKHRFFKFPIEYHALRLAKSILRKLQLSSFYKWDDINKEHMTHRDQLKDLQSLGVGA